MKGLFIRALETKQKIVLMYLDKEEKLTQRVVKVIKMNNDYLLVYCYYRKKLRTLKISNILSAEPIKKQVS